MFNDTITLFTFLESSGMWYPHIISGCDCGVAKSATATALSGTTRADTSTLIIPCSSAKIIVTQAGEEKYISPKEYAKLANPMGYITFRPETDFFLLGARDIKDDNGENGKTFEEPVQTGSDLRITSMFFNYASNEYNQPISDDDYDSGLYDYLNSENDDIFMITSAEFFGAIPHFELGGR